MGRATLERDPRSRRRVRRGHFVFVVLTRVGEQVGRWEARVIASVDGIHVGSVYVTSHNNTRGAEGVL